MHLSNSESACGSAPQARYAPEIEMAKPGIEEAVAGQDTDARADCRIYAIGP